MHALTLTQAAKALGVMQHRLIHLCEQNVVMPDVQDARGRGSSRTFSRRNLFEFAIALEMRRSKLPLSLARTVLGVLRSFESEVSRQIPGFVLPDSLMVARGPRVLIVILNGTRLYFVLRAAAAASAVFGGIDVPVVQGGRSGTRSKAKLGPLPPIDTRREFATARTRTEINLSRIAHDLKNIDD